MQTTVDSKADKTAINDLDADMKLKANQSELNTLSELVNTKASQESLNDVAAAVDTKAGVDALEKFMGIVNEQLTKLQEENAALQLTIADLTARIEALENPATE